MVQCNLGLLLQRFTALETLSCYECDLSVGNSLDDLTTALSNLEALHDVHLVLTGLEGKCLVLGFAPRVPRFALLGLY